MILAWVQCSCTHHGQCTAKRGGRRGRRRRHIDLCRCICQALGPTGDCGIPALFIRSRPSLSILQPPGHSTPPAGFFAPEIIDQDGQAAMSRLLQFQNLSRSDLSARKQHQMWYGQKPGQLRHFSCWLQASDIAETYWLYPDISVVPPLQAGRPAQLAGAADAAPLVECHPSLLVHFPAVAQRQVKCARSTRLWIKATSHCRLACDNIN